MLRDKNDPANTMESWSGHLPVTTTALLSIFDRDIAGTANLTTADRVLYTACEIRCAVATRSLVECLGSEDPIGAICRASTAFAEIGAVHFVRDLQRAAGELETAPTPGRRHHCLAVLEDRLVCTEDPIDALIARYAWSCLREYLGGAKQTPLGSPLS